MYFSNNSDKIVRLTITCAYAHPGGFQHDCEKCRERYRQSVRDRRAFPRGHGACRKQGLPEGSQGHQHPRLPQGQGAAHDHRGCVR